MVRLDSRLLILAIALLALPGAWLRSARALEGKASTITVAMEDCEATRPGTFTVANLPKDLKPEEIQNDPDGVRQKILEALKPQKLVKKGRLKVSGQSVDIYLPEPKEPYTAINKGTSDGHSDNTSTLISIDSNGDGKLTKDEGWFASLPVRIGDKMWEITSIAADGSRIELKPSGKPIAGVVVGRKCPPFSYRTEEGKQVTQDTAKGKALLLDIWSVT
jgi:hypothetical protein